MRGLAALAVVVFHIRNRYFLDYDSLPSPGLLTKAFYALTAFGHDAVIVFFVLSGYLISSKVLRDAEGGRWSWTSYAVNRLTRLYVVLLPGLLLTLFWDGLRLWLFPDGPVFIGDRQQPWVSDFVPLPRSLALDLVGNALFLQTILVYPLGTNGALWSLSYEFWYYLLFPLPLLARGGSRARSIAMVVVVAAILLLIGARITLYFPIWLLGSMVYAAPKIKGWTRVHSRVITLGSAALFMLLVAFTHTSRFEEWSSGSETVNDYVTALSCAALLYVLTLNQAPSSHARYQQLSRTLAGFSYTLYVTHLPLLVFIRGALPASPRLPSASNYSLVLILMLTCVAFAYLVSRITEARTDDVRRAVMRLINARPSATPVRSG